MTARRSFSWLGPNWTLLVTFYQFCHGDRDLFCFRILWLRSVMDTAAGAVRAVCEQFASVYERNNAKVWQIVPGKAGRLGEGNVARNQTVDRARSGRAADGGSVAVADGVAILYIRHNGASFFQFAHDGLSGRQMQRDRLKRLRQAGLACDVVTYGRKGCGNYCRAVRAGRSQGVAGVGAGGDQCEGETRKRSWPRGVRP